MLSAKKNGQRIANRAVVNGAPDRDTFSFRTSSQARSDRTQRHTDFPRDVLIRESFEDATEYQHTILQLHPIVRMFGSKKNGRRIGIQEHSHG
jgi:hypothetical protein